jgi:hypothetical protein
LIANVALNPHRKNVSEVLNPYNLVIWTIKAKPINCPLLLSVLFFNNSWNSEGETFELLRLDDVVRIQISTEPDKNNYGKRYKARAVFDWRKKWEQKKEKGSIKSPKSHPSESVIERLFH